MKVNTIIRSCALFMVGAVLTMTSLSSIGVGHTKEAVHSAGPSICQVQGDRMAYVGRRIVLSLVYSFDGGSHEMLIDKSCQGRNILNVTTALGEGDSTVKNFFDAYDAHCRAGRKGVWCSYKVEIEAEVTIVQNGDGTLAGNLERIFSYNFLE